MYKLKLSDIAVCDTISCVPKPTKVFIGLPKVDIAFRTHPEDVLENVRLVYSTVSGYYLLDGSKIHSEDTRGETIARLYRGVDETGREWVFIASSTKKFLWDAFESAKEKWITRRPKDIFVPSDNKKFPQWSTATFEEVINIAFENRILTNIDDYHSLKNGA